MKDTVLLQVRLSNILKVQGLAKAKEYGFSSLQQMIKFLLQNIVTEQLKLCFCYEDLKEDKKTNKNNKKKKNSCKVPVERESKKKRQDITSFDKTDDVLECLLTLLDVEGRGKTKKNSKKVEVE